MCGIAGIVYQRDAQHDAIGAVRRMIALQRYRGPDGEGFYDAPGAALGHCRLAIIDLSDAGHQPMRDPSGRYCLTYNGEIYNYLELASELRALGHRFQGHSDTEVLLTAYRQWGEGCLARLRGMFAFAIWDEHEQRLLAARDRLGIKPFHYWTDNRTSDQAWDLKRDIMRVRQRWQADRARYYAYLGNRPGLLQRLQTLLLTEALWAIGLFRFGQYLCEEAPTPVQRLLFLPYQCTAKLLELITGIHLYPGTQIGPGLYIGHYGGIWVSSQATLGAYCNLSQGVVIGVAGRNARGAPQLGDYVWVGPHAMITGPVRIGSGAVVAANSLVVANVPENAVVIGVPAKVVSYSGSAHLMGGEASSKPQQ